MKKIMLTAIAILSQMAATAQQIFIYSPNEKEGLHIAALQDGRWQHIGQLCGSDYGAWGAEKRMHDPSVCRAADGTWRLVFAVNTHSPVIAAAYSRDLVNWRPQDYPIMSVTPCTRPLVRQEDDGTFTILFRTNDGLKRQVTASNDFRHFSADEPCNKSDWTWLRDTASVDGKAFEGNIFTISSQELAHINSFFEQQARDARLSGERMHDDGTRLKGLQPVTATLSVSNSEKAISDKLIGIFFEDISYAADGGLYAELVQNRDFEYTPRDRRGWHASTAWHSPAEIAIGTDNPLSSKNPHYAIVKNDSLWNEGWDGIAVEKGKKYDFSIFVRGSKTISAVLLKADGTAASKSIKIKAKGDNWKQYQATMTATATDAKCRLLLMPEGEHEAAVDMVSLFPRETFKNRKNGLRRDLAQVIADLKPRFVRFPGGCMSHGQGLDNIYHWQHSIGPLWERTPDMNIWHYHQTRGLGFFEYFLFCEDIGAEPLPVLAAGVPCQNSAINQKGIGGQQGGIPMEDMQAYIQELLDLIEWANGDPATSQWARMRADAGHPQPFNLKYIGIGNEDIISTVFEERYEMICKAIRQKYPNISICGTVGPFHTPSADYLEGWDFTLRKPELQDLVDEHYYESTGWFMHHQDYYDRYDRSAAKVYLGEWAASTKARRPNVETALAEAMYLCNIERNGDVVAMTSYAPMLCKDGHSNWNPDMIYFTNTNIRTTPAYDVQRLFSLSSGDRYIASTLTSDNAAVSHRMAASIVKDSTTGRKYLKLVNALPTELTVNISGMEIPAGAKARGFSGKPEEQRTAVKEAILDGGSQVKLPAYTLYIIEL